MVTGGENWNSWAKKLYFSMFRRSAPFLCESLSLSPRGFGIEKFIYESPLSINIKRRRNFDSFDRNQSFNFGN